MRPRTAARGIKMQDSAVLTGYVALGTDPSGTDPGSVGNVLNAADGTVNLANMRLYADVAGGRHAYR